MALSRVVPLIQPPCPCQRHPLRPGSNADSGTRYVSRSWRASAIPKHSPALMYQGFGNFMGGSAMLGGTRLLPPPRHNDSCPEKRYVRRRVIMKVAGHAGPPKHGFDYYELLGVDPNGSQDEIKQAYRTLQKRCHPDIAGEQLGHDMALLLNEAYAVLADPQLRATYDQNRVLWIGADGYTGRPLHSSWQGPESEDRAVFVDESACIGCLKCALVARNTFAIELRHGRARCVRQWGDDEATIRAAMASCPVDCIRMVPRSKLPALEFMMAKLPRTSVGVMRQCGGGGRRKIDVYQAVDVFLAKRAETLGAHHDDLKAMEVRQRAADGIHTQRGFSRGSKEGAWQGQAPLVPLSPEARLRLEAATAAAAYQARMHAAMLSASRSAAEDVPEDLQVLFKAAAMRREGEGVCSSWQFEIGEDDEEYWRPAEHVSHAVSFPTPAPPPPPPLPTSPRRVSFEGTPAGKRHAAYVARLKASWLAKLPPVVAVAAAAAVGLTYHTEVAQSATALAPLNAVARFALETSSSGPVPQMALAATAWYFVTATLANIWLGVASFAYSADDNDDNGGVDHQKQANDGGV